jgi:GrpB-like predicted nucleotidyltransferase (UPF0157 family)
MDERVIIEEYDPNWKNKYILMRGKILEKIGEFVIDIQHIGSTSIPGLASKPIIDILIGVRSLDDADKCVPNVCELDFEYVKEHEKIIPDRRYFRKPRNGFGKREYHLHMCVFDGEFWKKQILFRDYLITHPEALKEYEKLKKDLASKFRNNRHAYTDGKDEFIQEILNKAQM